MTGTPFIQKIAFQGTAMHVLRLDAMHPEVSGNKWFKLKYHLEKAHSERAAIVTFGGAHSNHIAATAAAAQLSGIPCAGIIRGGDVQSPTLADAARRGMHLEYVSRSAYKEGISETLQEKLRQKIGPFIIIPEGGRSAEGMRGSAEIAAYCGGFENVFCACGTATTFAGIVSAVTSTVVTGISVLKGQNTLPQDAGQLLRSAGCMHNIYGNGHPEDFLSRHSITNVYAGGGYASFDPYIVSFKTAFELETGLLLDHVYTAKLFYAVTDLIRKDHLATRKPPLVIHSGGLQGNQAFEMRYALKLNALSAQST